MRNYFFTTIIIGLLGLSACKQETIKNFKMPPYTNKLVLNSILRNDQPFSANVSFSMPALDFGDPKYTSAAKIYIYEGTNLIDSLTYSTFSSDYQGTKFPQPGVLYKVECRHAGYPFASATTAIPNKVPGFTSSFKDSTNTDSSGFPTGTIKMTFKDEVGENYYKVKLFYYENFLSEWRDLAIETNDPALDEFGEINNDGSISFEDLGFEGKTKEIEFITPFAIATGTPKFIVVFETISKELYNYYTSLTRYEIAKDNPFAEPVFIYTNIANGLGIFAGSYIQRDTLK